MVSRRSPRAAVKYDSGRKRSWITSIATSPRCRREALIPELYQTCAPTSRSAATIQGARRASGQTSLRAASTKDITDLCACSVVRPLLSGFIHQSAP